MNEYKTPEQVAEDVYWTISEFPENPKGSDLRALMTRAILADRVQYKNRIAGLEAEIEYLVTGEEG